MCSKPVPGEEVPAWFEEGPQLSYHAAAHHEDFGVANLNQRRTTPIPRWNELKPEIPPENEEEALRLVAGGSYIASRGPDGIVELRRWIEVASGQPWLRRIQVHWSRLVVEVLMRELSKKKHLQRGPNIPLFELAYPPKGARGRGQQLAGAHQALPHPPRRGLRRQRPRQRRLDPAPLCRHLG